MFGIPFPKGNVPWNKGAVGVMKAWNKGLTGYMAGEKHYNYGKERPGVGGNPSFVRGMVPWNKGKKYSRFTDAEKREIESLRAKNNRARRALVDGRFGLPEWRMWKELHGNMCVWCETPEEFSSLSIDHIVPLSRGGDNFLRNIQPLCSRCNSAKKNHEMEFYCVGVPYFLESPKL